MTDASTEEETSLVVKPVKEVPVIQDEGFFRFSTGDTYDGYFEAKKKDHSLKMHGHGVYITAEGDVYTGKWDGDKLGANDEVTITFVDSSTYHGSFKEWCYSGRGKYLYPDGSALVGDFIENFPVGNLMLLDPNGHTWLGKAEQGFGRFEPVNHFYSMLEKSRESLRRRRVRKTT